MSSLIMLTGSPAGNGPPRLEQEEREYIHALYSAHYRALRAYALRLGLRGEAVDDLLQETFLVAIRRVDALRKTDNPRAWLIQVLRNVVGYHLRCMKYADEAWERLLEHAGEGAEETRDELSPELLYRGLVKEEELRLLLGFYRDGKPQKELARELGIDLGACKMRLKRAREHLREALEQEERK